MKKKLVILFFFQIFLLKANAQYGFEKMVELTGVVMSADSLRYLPFVTISNISKKNGTNSNDRGVFSLIAEQGDTLEYSSIGYRKKRYVIPKTLSSARYSVIQLMTQDTFYLPATIVRPQATQKEFEIAFKNAYIPDDKFEIARKNTEYQTLRILAQTMPKDGRESQHYLQNQLIKNTYWAGQQPPMAIFNPLAWLDFYKAWKRGDYKRKK
ncbi:MAG: carboxypeptidase-like regulatory domain-containing protein [Chitinophagaceae bacterium]